MRRRLSLAIAVSLMAGFSLGFWSSVILMSSFLDLDGIPRKAIYMLRHWSDGPSDAPHVISKDKS